MRLRSLQLTRYGNFADAQVGFETRPGCVNLLVAPNGAGKSVLRAALGDLLFNIHPQTPMAFRHGYTGMRIAAEVETGRGQRVTLRRRKGLGATLLDEEDRPHPPALIAGLLGDSDRALLERLFALDTERLRAGGEALLASGGALAEALLSGAGVGGARQLARALEDEADKLAPARKSDSRPFYAALDRVAAARHTAREALLRPEAWERMREELATLEAAREQSNATARALSLRIAGLQRVRRVRAPLRERDEALAWLAAHPDAPDLPATLADRLAEATQRRQVAADKLHAEADRAALLAAERAAIVVDEALLEQAVTVEALVEQAGAVSKALADLPPRVSEHATVSGAVAAGLRRLGSGLAPEQAGTLVPTRPAEVRARELIAAHAAPVAAVRDGPAALAEQKAVIAAREQELAALEVAGGGLALAPLLAEIRADGDPARQAHALEEAVRQARSACAAALALAPGPHREVRELIALAPAPPAAYERLDAARRDDAEALRRQQERVDEIAERRDRQRDDLARLTAGRVVADRATLASARARRDAGWHLVYRLAFTANPPAAAEQRGFAGEQPLPLAYERAVRTADELADRRAEDSDLLAQAAAAQDALRRTEEEAGPAGEALAPRRARAEAAERAWSAACAALGLDGGAAIAEVRSLLAAREQVVARSAALDAAMAAAAALAQAHAGWASRLAAAIGEPQAPDLPLPALLATAEALLAEAERRQARRIELAAGLRELHHKHERDEAALAAAGQALAAWEAAWQSALADLGRPADETPAVTAEVLRLLADLDRDHRDAEKLAERIRDMRRDVAAFAQGAAAVLHRLAPGEPAPDPEPAAMLAAVRALRTRLDEARQQAARRAGLGGQIAAAERLLAQLRTGLERCAASEREILAAIGAQTVEGAERRLALARERAEQRARVAAAEARLAEQGDGLAIDALRAELAPIAAGEVQVALEEAETARQSASETAQEQAAEAARRREELARQEDSTRHEAAAAEIQSGIATLSRVLDEAVRYRLAARLLDQALAAVEDSETPAMLSRIGGYFRTLTCAAFERVGVAEEDAGPALLLVPREAPDERKRVGELSEGTRDQLYLALRLAAIEERVAQGPALPFLGDDILQTSDDARAAAALAALVGLSHHVQVILLSHHAHLGVLARALPPAALHLCTLVERG